MDLLLILPTLIILVVGLVLVLKSKPGRTYRRDSVDSDTKNKVEDLHRMQTHSFWRDFDK